MVDGVITTVPIEPATAWEGEDTVTASCGMAVVVVTAEFVAGVALSGVSDRVAAVVWAPGVVENVTDALIAPRAVPAPMGVAVVDVQVSVSFATVVVPSAQEYPAGVGAAANVSPAGRMDLTTGSWLAGADPVVIAGPIVSE